MMAMLALTGALLGCEYSALAMARVAGQRIFRAPFTVFLCSYCNILSSFALFCCV